MELPCVMSAAIGERCDIVADWKLRNRVQLVHLSKTRQKKKQTKNLDELVREIQSLQKRTHKTQNQHSHIKVLIAKISASAFTHIHPRIFKKRRRGKKHQCFHSRQDFQWSIDVASVTQVYQRLLSKNLVQPIPWCLFLKNGNGRVGRRISIFLLWKMKLFNGGYVRRVRENTHGILNSSVTVQRQGS